MIMIIFKKHQLLIKKNKNTLISVVPMVIMTQSAVNWRNTRTHVDRTHSLIHLHQHRYDHVVRSAGSAITEFGFKYGSKNSTQIASDDICVWKR